ncbi:hypothetical protein A3I28_01670 [Candidatus Giovannonibacteria bacterium RIFCSPLOWO2_02_FULL_43_37]|uniref:Uncharacterized protein n=1 Tax=Candidatus Giovannonibacteria bacterium RIFCSPLOWO2_12_FULL_43_26 TaxID=1798363 RepID=A0A1F5XVT5_9BACT|nr:MAG: hypothetical protein A3I28_01670 [Candidatus Giovannonibacteria bacterium RIFCSPLOWO2_02_FULL_43_37]OGF91999.1 MAG: hypothetical protein A3H05_03145 [Candidatus Giovannonibacteria bacterium RIFCSPLOWO2_12_FULL_43_26]
MERIVIKQITIIREENGFVRIEKSMPFGKTHAIEMEVRFPVQELEKLSVSDFLEKVSEKLK